MSKYYKFGSDPVQYCLDGDEYTWQVIECNGKLEYRANDQLSPQLPTHLGIIEHFGLTTP